MKSNVLCQFEPRPYQERDVEEILKRLDSHQPGYKLLYQLPTGGGKTVIFSEVARRYLELYSKKVLILTHRVELCRQTAKVLEQSGARTATIDADTHELECGSFDCFVAMVESLDHRLERGEIDLSGTGLIIVDEAHYNAFYKLLDRFPMAIVLGVTATPLSSDVTRPLRATYSEILLGETIGSLISQGYLARPKSVASRVDLGVLSIGQNGDYTTASSDALYSTPAMLDLLAQAYTGHSPGKKTLIFNAGIAASKAVEAHLSSLGLAVRHLDNETNAAERQDILHWFRRTRGAILTSVSILTTGFDEPGVQTIILNRATTSVTLFHQMVGRGARRLPRKKTFLILDLGGNCERFGQWEDPVDWEYVFNQPEEYLAGLQQRAEESAPPPTGISAELRARFSQSVNTSFDISEAFVRAKLEGESTKNVIRDSIRQHARVCLENAESLSEAMNLAESLLPDIRLRVKQYISLLEKATTQYRNWLIEDYQRRLEVMVRRSFKQAHAVEPTSGVSAMS